MQSNQKRRIGLLVLVLLFVLSSAFAGGTAARYMYNMSGAGTGTVARPVITVSTQQEGPVEFDWNVTVSNSGVRKNYSENTTGSYVFSVKNEDEHGISDIAMQYTITITVDSSKVGTGKGGNLITVTSLSRTDGTISALSPQDKKVDTNNKNIMEYQFEDDSMFFDAGGTVTCHEYKVELSADAADTGNDQADAVISVSVAAVQVQP